jgi:hypothetical protein
VRRWQALAPQPLRYCGPALPPGKAAARNRRWVGGDRGLALRGATAGQRASGPVARLPEPRPSFAGPLAGLRVIPSGGVKSGGQQRVPEAKGGRLDRHGRVALPASGWFRRPGLAPHHAGGQPARLESRPSLRTIGDPPPPRAGCSPPARRTSGLPTFSHAAPPSPGTWRSLRDPRIGRPPTRMLLPGTAITMGVPVPFSPFRWIRQPQGPNPHAGAGLKG